MYSCQPFIRCVTMLVSAPLRVIFGGHYQTCLLSDVIITGTNWCPKNF